MGRGGAGATTLSRSGVCIGGKMAASAGTRPPQHGDHGGPPTARSRTLASAAATQLGDHHRSTGTGGLDGHLRLTPPVGSGVTWFGATSRWVLENSLAVRL